MCHQLFVPFQLLARLRGRPSVDGVAVELFSDGPKPKDVIEFYGSSGAGKTEMLLHVVKKCIMPKMWKDVSLGGFDVEVLYIDTDHKLPILRLATLVEKHVTDAIKVGSLSDASPSDPSEEEVECLIKRCLNKLQIYHCRSSQHLLITLHSIEMMLSTNADVSILVIDSISAFYWNDRYSGGDSTASQEAKMKHIVKILKILLDSYGLILFATKAALFRKKWRDFKNDELNTPTRDGWTSKCVYENLQIHTEFLCKEWTKLVTRRYIFERTKDVGQHQYFRFNVFDVKKESKKGFSITESGVLFDSSNCDV